VPVPYFNALLTGTGANVGVRPLRNGTAVLRTPTLLLDLPLSPSAELLVKGAAVAVPLLLGALILHRSQFGQRLARTLTAWFSRVGRSILMRPDRHGQRARLKREIAELQRELAQLESMIPITEADPGHEVFNDYRNSLHRLDRQVRELER